MLVVEGTEIRFQLAEANFYPSAAVNIVQPYALRTETYITVCHRRFRKGKLLALVIIVQGTDIIREMCLGAYIPQGNTSPVAPVQTIFP